MPFERKGSRLCRQTKVGSLTLSSETSTGWDGDRKGQTALVKVLLSPFHPFFDSWPEPTKAPDSSVSICSFPAHLDSRVPSPLPPFVSTAQQARQPNLPPPPPSAHHQLTPPQEQTTTPTPYHQPHRPALPSVSPHLLVAMRLIRTNSSPGTFGCRCRDGFSKVHRSAAWPLPPQLALRDYIFP